MVRATGTEGINRNLFEVPPTGTLIDSGSLDRDGDTVLGEIGMSLGELDTSLGTMDTSLGDLDTSLGAADDRSDPPRCPSVMSGDGSVIPEDRRYPPATRSEPRDIRSAVRALAVQRRRLEIRFGGRAR
jgi:hypothetical protein